MLSDKIKKIWNKLFWSISIVAAFVTIVAAVLTICSLNIAREQTKKLESMAQEIPTRSLGFSPNHFNEVIRIINQSHIGDSITIFNDILGYGIYSSPDKFEEYLISIVTALKKNVNIDIFIWNHSLISEIGMHRLKIEEDSLKIKTLQEAGFKKEAYQNAFHRKTNYNDDTIIKDILNFRYSIFSTTDINTTIGEYFKRLDILFSYMENKLDSFPNCQIIPCDKEFAIHFWKRNQDEAIYSFPGKREIQEITFFTREINFLEYLSMIKKETLYNIHRK